MKKLIWLALLLPFAASANPYTNEYCNLNPMDDICIGFNLDRDRLDALENRLTELEARVDAEHPLPPPLPNLPAEYGDPVDINLVPTVCIQGTWADITGLYADASGIWYPNGTMWFTYDLVAPRFINTVNFYEVISQGQGKYIIAAQTTGGGAGVALFENGTAGANENNANSCLSQLISTGLL